MLGALRWHSRTRQGRATVLKVAAWHDMDVMTKVQRSAAMSRIRGKDTKPELVVRRLAHALGYRFRLHRRDLPGTPDLAFPSKRKVIFVHGCFWHRHRACRFAYIPKSNAEFWSGKFAATLERDKRAIRSLRKQGWDPLILWECELSNVRGIERRLILHLDSCDRSRRRNRNADRAR